LCRILFELNRLVPSGMPGGVRGGRNFPLLNLFKRNMIINLEIARYDCSSGVAFRYLLPLGMAVGLPTTFAIPTKAVYGKESKQMCAVRTMYQILQLKTVLYKI